MERVKYIFISLFVVATLNSYSQDRRLALVIGNSNYSEGKLINSVNDALLMKATLESLNFDVILDTNIKKIDEFQSVVKEFGDKRDDYEVGFIYYAGHGVQINDVNYLERRDQHNI
jgi:uncharacterized caspase-like protein